VCRTTSSFNLPSQARGTDAVDFGGSTERYSIEKRGFMQLVHMGGSYRKQTRLALICVSNSDAKCFRSLKLRRERYLYTVELNYQEDQ
jgi:hypothetical protein